MPPCVLRGMEKHCQWDQTQLCSMNSILEWTIVPWLFFMQRRDKEGCSLHWDKGRWRDFSQCPSTQSCIETVILIRNLYRPWQIRIGILQWMNEWIVNLNPTVMFGMLFNFRYRNIYCTQCHGVAGTLKFWKGDIGCNRLLNDSCRNVDAFSGPLNPILNPTLKELLDNSRYVALIFWPSHHRNTTWTHNRAIVYGMPSENKIKTQNGWC